uniref:Uncharacterized protein n=1 Tax=Salix viminalis TaxID=40686 RepID=A0A6N2N2B4_SALVM
MVLFKSKKCKAVLWLPVPANISIVEELIGMYASHFSVLQKCVSKLDRDIPRLECWMEVIANFLSD